MYNVESLKKNWVSPDLCQKLQEFLQIKTAFIWKQRPNGSCDLETTLFDTDNYYGVVNELLVGSGYIQIFPAFTIQEMESVLPDYSLTREGGKYHVRCKGIFHLETVSEKLADALAVLVINGCRSNLLNTMEIKNAYNG